MAMITADIIVIGAGIAGASAASLLSKSKDVVILEMEDQPGYHTTGRSAALFTVNYGSEAVQALTKASKNFFMQPPNGFCEVPLLTERGIIHLARVDQLEQLEIFKKSNPTLERLSQAELAELIPYLNSDHIVAGLSEPDASDIDVAALHQGYLKQAKHNGAKLYCNQRVLSLRYENKMWSLESGKQFYQAPIVVNAAGAWADEIAILAGIKPVGLRALKRTAAVVKFDKPINPDMCFLNDIDENWYCKPEGSHLFLSPEDEVPSPACDAWADDMDVAMAIDQITNILNIEPIKVEASWAGLRVFSPDRDFVIGYDTVENGFFWLAGQGGYGIQTAPAVASIASSLILGENISLELKKFGVSASVFSPDRFSKPANPHLQA